MALAPLHLIDHSPLPSAPDLAVSDVPLHLLLPPPLDRAARRWQKVLAASLLFHVFLFLAAIQLTRLVRIDEPAARSDVRSVPLYLPPDLLTQREPNRRPPSKTIDLAEIRPSPARQPQAASPSRKSFALPKPASAPQRAKAGSPVLPTPPQLAANIAPTPPAALPARLPPPPAPSPVVKSGPFQNVASAAPLNPHPTLLPPKSPLAAAPSELGQMVPGQLRPDANSPEAAPRSPGAVAQPAVPRAAVELQSDPQGADFKPYLNQILAIVRANWRRVVPESARNGSLHGRTVMEFIIDRSGRITKVVTADPSGSDALDRAALVGLSMSDPLPPLPADFKGFQVRLSFTFSYNLSPQP